MINTPIYLDVHILQTFPSSCLNRDDLGAPKSCVFGDVQRARISSQCLKRATRTYYYEKEVDSIRTRNPFRFIEEEILQVKPGLDFQTAAIYSKYAYEFATTDSGKKDVKKASRNSKDSEKKQQVETPVFISRKQAAELAKLIVKDDGKPKEKELYKNALKNNCSDDIWLFGRMFAGQGDLSVDAACQVAHAISTNEVFIENDFFSAVEEDKSDNSAASAYIGTSMFNSATYYRFASVNVSDLAEKAGSPEKAVEMAVKFAKSFVYAMPSGKITSYGNKTLPGLVYITVGNDSASFVNAFEEPVRIQQFDENKNGIMKQSVQKFSEFKDFMENTFLEKPEFEYLTGLTFGSLPQSQPFNSVLKQVEEDLHTALEDEG
ncbi:MAG: type I-E CRISPR-associated protein Cas7/Cse4/CasC [Erysipelotrichaceae bacterium]|nr:type I-E CRISPR-associated protein Cas7/Cse4/CasC [Erysipelotrichaceae bacterium]